MHHIVTTRTPLRISFFGGGTDLPEYYLRDYGAVLSTAIKLYVYVTIKPHGQLFDEPIRLNYSQTELVSAVDDIQNAIAREGLRITNVQAPIYVSTVADVPSGSGLGSSSSFAVGLLHACYTLQGRTVTPGDLAAQACDLEIVQLRKPIGKQDQYAAAYGGINHLRFDKNNRVSITPLHLLPENVERLFSSFLLFWTGVTREADAILKDQNNRTACNITLLDSMRSLCERAVEVLTRSDFQIEEFGAMLDESWHLKRALTPKIADDSIASAYQAGIAAGAYGGKLCGAGGGGFLLFCAPPERHNAIRSALHHLRQITIEYDSLGSRVLFPGYFQFGQRPVEGST